MASPARPLKAGELGKRRRGGRDRRGGPARSDAGRRRGGRAGRTAAVAIAAECGFVLGYRFGKLPYQPRKLLDLGAQRLRRRARLVGNGFELAFDGAKASSEFRDLARDVARTAREAGNLIADLGAVVFAAGDGVVDRKRGQNAKSDQAESVSENAKRRKSAPPSEAAMRTMHNTVKMALMRTMLTSWPN